MKKAEAIEQIKLLNKDMLIFCGVSKKKIEMIDKQVDQQDKIKAVYFVALAKFLKSLDVPIKNVKTLKRSIPDYVWDNYLLLGIENIETQEMLKLKKAVRVAFSKIPKYTKEHYEV